ncbi:DUF6616 family protein [Autumnicola musiva]
MADAGWHEYFSQVNARGQIIPLNETLNS